MRLLDRLPTNRTRAATRPWARPLRAALAGLLCLGQLALSGPAQAQGAGAAQAGLRRVDGMVMLDYSRLTLSTGGAFDLLSVHYLQQATDWLYYGVGAFAPMTQGNYGGFFGADATIHAQRRVAGNFFVNAGVSVGAGAGGASVVGIQTLSGDGLYLRAYAGVGYETRTFSFGVNYARVAITGSPVNDAAVNIFVQRRLGFSVGNYDAAGTRLPASSFDAPRHENILSFQFNNFAQIRPTGRYTGDIGVLSTQFTHFMNRNFYTFFGVDIGVSGLLWYNQAHGGIGWRTALSPHLNLYSQIGIGSSGWVTNTVDTGPGFVIYPKLMLEYLWDNGVGATLQAGYLYAPLGTSRNWTVGLGLNYHLSYAEGRSASGPQAGDDYQLRGIRLNVFGRRTSDITYNGRVSDPLNLIAVQVDYALSDHWFVSAQIAAAANAFRNYAGYAEGYFGIGWQTRVSRNGRFQGYAQLMYGLNDVGVDPAHEVGALLYPAIGVNFHLNDRLSLYGQLGTTISLGQYSGMTNTFENYSIGLGVTYRFSLPTRS
ncbi:MAG: hypothetical protein KDK12_11800 [Rhodobacteraceae bacterium]|nr:hypothetical protein [Paracoccaceae bacterium]